MFVYNFHFKNQNDIKDENTKSYSAKKAVTYKITALCHSGQLICR